MTSNKHIWIHWHDSIVIVLISLTSGRQSGAPFYAYVEFFSLLYIVGGFLNFCVVFDAGCKLLVDDGRSRSFKLCLLTAASPAGAVGVWQGLWGGGIAPRAL